MKIVIYQPLLVFFHLESMLWDVNSTSERAILGDVHSSNLSRVEKL